MSVAARSGNRARNSAPMTVVARFGLSARAFVYLVVGVLVIALAFGHKRSETDQRGAMQTIAAQSGGAVLILLVALGLAAYAVWRFAEAAFGVAGEGKKTGPRLQSLARGLVYTALAFSAFSVFAGRNQSQAAQNRELSARVMTHAGGRFLVGAVGVVVAVIGVVLVVQGVQRSFEKYLRLGGLSEATRKAVITLGVVGTVARGAVVALVGILIVDAAVRFDPNKASGIDAAVRTVGEQPLGRVLLVLTGAGLVAFGIYGLAEARWRIT
ncbi:MAG: hypothetical protein QOF92_580 [Pseudonocardiales bacterium]|nr:hypothetical protein [Pseudonocardiales bacterium]MDT4927713.1 hypothetical protein [Pseudonocardiales bacterium]MDT4950094.1 hypothetical protein [Pseudonocardiales bacterium]